MLVRFRFFGAVRAVRAVRTHRSFGADRVRSVLAALALALCSPVSRAEAWPNKPIKLVVGFAVGGPTDLIARVLAERLTVQLGHPVVVDNKTGAGGNIAAEAIAHAAPDGYTLFYNTSAIVIAPALYGKLGYDALRDFEPIGAVATVPMVALVHPSVPAATIAELLTYAKANPGRLNYASSGTGTIAHLATAAWAAHSGIQMQHISYKGSAPALIDTAAGVTQVITDTINSALPYIRDGRLRPLAVTTRKRFALLPDVPTLDETVMPGMEMSAWQGLMAPRGTPAPIIERLHAEMRAAMAQPQTLAKLEAQGAIALTGTREQYAEFIRSELQRWAQLIKATGAQAD
jgi:tripartite-type tricarboxylate transporter receptor subunit TctC